MAGGRAPVPRIDRNCEYCGKHFQTLPRLIGLGFGRFCSQSCARFVISKQPRKRHGSAHALWRGGRTNEKDRIYQKAQRVRDPRKPRARDAVRHAIKSGRITKGPCVICGKTDGRIEAHHNDYDKPLEVTWVCPSHHRQIHNTLPRGDKHWKRREMKEKNQAQG